MHQPFLQQVTDQLAAEPGLDALFLAGSFGRGTADRFSDIDLVAVAAVGDHARIAALWRTTLEQLAPVVFWNERRGRGILLNAVTEAWLRCDMHITAPEHLGRRAHDTVRPLLDRAGLYDRLPATLPSGAPDPERVAALVNEFIRVLGLMPVGLGRHEYVTLVKGVGLLRDMLTDLMVEDCPLPDRGGALHLSRLISPEQMALLEALPYPGPEPDAIVAAHVAIAEAFLPIAREMTARLAIPWPDRFEAATRARLQRELGITFAA